MQIHSILVVLLCGTTFVSLSATDYHHLRCNFSEGIPSDFTLIDADGNTPSTDIAKYKFSVGTPWVTYYDKEEKNHVAASTSWYTPSGTSCDWLILPPVTVTSVEDIASWRARATDATYSDGYAVYVTEGVASSVDDFATSSPQLNVDAENSTWTHRSVSLGNYVGKTVSVTIVNNSTDCSVLYVDDLLAENGLYQVTANTLFNSSIDNTRYQMAYVIIENDVYEPNNSRYVQHNIYHSGEYGEMGGYEKELSLM